jgi:hypothetical protein
MLVRLIIQGLCANFGVRTTSLVTLMALEKVCTKYDLDGGMMRIDDPGYKGIVFFATNPKRQEEEKKRRNRNGGK